MYSKPLFILNVLLIVVVVLGACAAPAPTATMPGDEEAEEEEAAAEVTAEACDDPELSILSAYGSSNDTQFKTCAEDFQTPAPASWHQAISEENEDMNMDEYMLVFYSAHGDHNGPKDAGGQTIYPENLPLGHCNDEDQGMLRYFLQASCNTMAHGPKNCTGANAHDDLIYECPGEWDPDANEDTEISRNVFQRWGMKLGDRIRMVCGTSTTVEPKNINIWGPYNINVDSESEESDSCGYYVADSIIKGLQINNVGLCLAKGGDEMANSPLVKDSRFYTRTNEFTNQDKFGEPHYHLQFSSDFIEYSPDHYFGAAENLVPQTRVCMPVLNVEEEEEKLGAQIFCGSQSRNFAKPASSEEKYFGDERTKMEADYIEGALRWIEKQKEWMEDDLRGKDDPIYAYGQHMMLTSIPEDQAKWDEAPLRVVEKNAIVTFPRRISLVENEAVRSGMDELGVSFEVIEESLGEIARYYEVNDRQIVTDTSGYPLIDLIGEGGRIEVQLNTDRESVIHAVKSWRPIKGVLGAEYVIAPDEAYQEAVNQLSEPDAYRLHYWDLGYREYAARVAQEEMRIWYQFHFVPTGEGDYTSDNYPPQQNWVLGQRGESCIDN